jgi:hypothetical protein
MGDYNVSKYNIDVSQITRVTDSFGNPLGFKTNRNGTSLFLHTLDWVGAFRTNHLGDFIIYTRQINRPIHGETSNRYIFIYDPPTQYEERWENGLRGGKSRKSKKKGKKTRRTRTKK